MKDEIKQIIQDSSKTILSCENLVVEIEKAIQIIIESINDGNKIVLFGNGGSAADAQHIAAEFIGRFNIERKSYPAISLTTDTSILTSLGNDYSYEIIFSRQCESVVSKGDTVIGISTSGNSENVLRGLDTSKRRGAKTIALLGNNGGIIKNNVDIALVVNSSSSK